MKRPIHLNELRLAASARPPDYFEDCVGVGIIEGEHLILTATAYRALQRKYRASETTIRAACGACPHFWRDQEFCAYPECRCAEKVRGRPWQDMPACPIRRW